MTLGRAGRVTRPPASRRGRPAPRRRRASPRRRRPRRRPRSPAAARAAITKARTLPGSLRPGADSTPVDTSTPKGWRWAMASATLSAWSPPDTMSRAGSTTPSARRQSKTSPDPGDWASTRTVVRAVVVDAGDVAVPGREGLDGERHALAPPSGCPRRVSSPCSCAPRRPMPFTISTTRVRRLVAEHPDREDLGRQALDDAPHRLGRDLARRGGEDEADGVGAQGHGQQGVGLGVMPQIFTSTGSPRPAAAPRCAAVACPDAMPGEGPHRGGAVGRPHQGLADQHGLVAGVGQARARRRRRGSPTRPRPRPRGGSARQARGAPGVDREGRRGRAG